MSIYSDKFKGFKETPTSDSLMELSNAIVEHTKRNLHVSTLGIVKKINGYEIYVKIFPTVNDENEKEIVVYNVFDYVLTVGSICLVVFLDKDFRQNYKEILANKSVLSKVRNIELHSEKFGVILTNSEAESAISSISVNGTQILPVEGNVNITIPTKTSQLTNDSDFITSSDVPKELYWCTYGVTTAEEIAQALTDGKLPYLIRDNNAYIYQFKSPSSLYYYFAYTEGTTMYYVRVKTGSSWSSGTSVGESTSNKVTSISSSSTNTQYPSAKCVYDNINDIKTNLTPSLANTAISANNKFTFTNVTFDSIGVFTFGNCNTFVNLYGLQVGVTYKQTGTFVYNTSGSVVTTTINVVRPTGTTNTIEISSGNSNFSIVNGYTGYLFKVKLG